MSKTSVIVKGDQGKRKRKKALSPEKRKMFLNALFSKHVSLSDARQSSAPYRYCLGNNGVYIMAENEIGSVVAMASTIYGADEIYPSFKMNMPKIPIYLLRQIIEFFKAVLDEKGKVEAFAQIFWSKQRQEYYIHVPIHEVSGSHITYFNDTDLHFDDILVLDIHSHNTMGAFFSSTDNKDDKEMHIVGVVGKVDGLIEMKFRIGVLGNFHNLNISDIFDRNEDVEFPREWLEKIKKKKYKTTKSTSGDYGSKYDGYGSKYDNCGYSGYGYNYGYGEDVEYGEYGGYGYNKKDEEEEIDPDFESRQIVPYRGGYSK
jgi:PRTRC genetic system protein A